VVYAATRQYQFHELVPGLAVTALSIGRTAAVEDSGFRLVEVGQFEGRLGRLAELDCFSFSWHRDGLLAATKTDRPLEEWRVIRQGCSQINQSSDSEYGALRHLKRFDRLTSCQAV